MQRRVAARLERQQKPKIALCTDRLGKSEPRQELGGQGTSQSTTAYSSREDEGESKSEAALAGQELSGIMALFRVCVHKVLVL
jgi:hypothetical protein